MDWIITDQMKAFCERDENQPWRQAINQDHTARGLCEGFLSNMCLPGAELNDRETMMMLAIIRLLKSYEVSQRSLHMKGRWLDNANGGLEEIAQVLIDLDFVSPTGEST
jgi:hypothetical protein